MENYFLPAEWMQQSAIMLTWPHRETIWFETLNAIDPVFVKVCVEIARHQRVIISYFDQEHHNHILELLSRSDAKMNNITLFQAPSNDIWVRDHGPITVIKKDNLSLLDFTFNGWGNKYPADHDNQLTQVLHTQGAFQTTELKKEDLVLEGGAIEVDGHGTLLTTRSCLLAASRNPHLTEDQITAHLQRLLGIKRILWLEHGALQGDDTDGHIDTLARFVDAHTICYVQCNDESDEHFEALKKMEEHLRTFTDYQGNPYRLVPLPWPSARYAEEDGRRLPATYANFLIINNAVLVPTYDDENDAMALKTLADCFPQREIIAIPSLATIQWYGSLHCMTMQLPKGVVA